MWRILKLSIFVAAFLAVPAIALAQSANTPVTQKLADGVYSVFWGSYNSLVVITSEGTVITDPAYPARAKVLKAEVAKLTNKPVRKIILTHEHYDHVGGTGEFAGAEIICHRSCADVFSLDTSGRVPAKIDVTYKDQLNIDYGGKLIELRHFGRADGVGMSVVHLPRERIVATADLYGPKFITNGIWMDDKNYLGTRKILNWIASQDLKHAIEAHNTNIDPAAARENAQFVNDLHDAVAKEMQAAMKAGGPGAVIKLITTLPNTLRLPAYQDWKGYNEHFPAHVRRMLLALFHGG